MTFLNEVIQEPSKRPQLPINSRSITPRKIRVFSDTVVISLNYHAIAIYRGWGGGEVWVWARKCPLKYRSPACMLLGMFVPNQSAH